MSDKSNKYGYVGVDIPAQSFGSNKGVFNPAEINELVADNKWTSFGQLELIETQTASSVTTLEFTSLETYNVHFLTLNDFSSDKDNFEIAVQLSSDGGSSYISSGYQYALQNGYSDGTFSESKTTGEGEMRLASFIGNATNETGQGYAYFYNLLDSTKYSFSTSHFMGVHGNTALGGGFTFGSNVLTSSATHNAIKIFFEGVGTATFSGVASLYGIRYS